VEVDAADLVDFEEVTNTLVGWLGENHRRAVPRILVVSHDSGRGKSSLLRKLHYQCEWVLNVPAALVALDEVDAAQQFDLVEHLAEQLGAFRGVSFPKFDPLNRARRMRQGAAFQQSLRGIVSMEQPMFLGGKQIFGQIATESIGKIENLNLEVRDQWSPGHEAEAQKICTEAFFADLPAISCNKPFVVLMDNVVVDKAPSSALQNWILRDLIRDRLISTVGHACHWVVVLAGHSKLGDMIRTRFAGDDAAWFSLAPDSLSGWTSEHVEEFVGMHAGPLPSPHLESIAHLIREERRPLTEAIVIARALVRAGD
jgi:hypothetical protein